jgi:hypothetical protein
MTAPKTIARIAGLFYVLNGSGFIFAESCSHDQVMVNA